MVHLVVLQHGLWGEPRNMQYLADLLEQRFSGKDCVIMNSGVNPGLTTYDGIDVCGDRLLEKLMSECKQLEADSKPVTQLSLIGYSMGGLITRYLAGRLLAQGFFDTVEPVNFVTVATPHLGSWRLPVGMVNKTFNSLVPVVISRVGHQLVLRDKNAWDKPLLCLMSHPELVFVKALRKFKKLLLLANIQHDRPVPYCTAAIRLDNPYELHKPVAIDSSFPSIVRPAETVSVVREPCGSQRTVKGKWIRVALVAMLPVVIPVMLWLSLKGQRHYNTVSKHVYDFDWIKAQHPQSTGASSSKSKAVDIDCPSASLDSKEETKVEEFVSAEALDKADLGSHELDDMEVDSRTHSATGAELLAPQEALQGAVTEQDVLLHEGIVELPSSLHKVQEWLVAKMNELPWQKVDVDCRNYHAHAAIIMRNPARFKENTDILLYMSEQMVM